MQMESLGKVSFVHKTVLLVNANEIWKFFTDAFKSNDETQSFCHFTVARVRGKKGRGVLMYCMCKQGSLHYWGADQFNF